MPRRTPRIPTQVIKKLGLSYVCCELSKRGWSVQPAPRWMRGVDLIISSSKGKRIHKILVKTLKGETAVPFGDRLDIDADYLIICRKILTTKPEIFIIDTDRARNKIRKSTGRHRESYWLEPRDYEEYRDNWNLIGEGED